MTGIYCIENTVNGKKYVGQAANIIKRWNDHKTALRNGSHYNGHLQRAWNKYGEGAFAFYCLEICDKESLNERECHYIKKLRSFESGYNMTMGGEGARGYQHSAEYKKRMSDLFRGKTYSSETRKRMSEAKKGIIPKETEARKKGRKVTAEKLRGRKFTKEHREKLSVAKKGKPSPRKGARMPEGYISPLKGKPLAEETKRKLSETMRGREQSLETRLKKSKRVRCIETGEIFDSVTFAANAYGISLSAISYAAKGKTATCKSLHWEFV